MKNNKKPKDILSLMREVRGTWTMNPVTRVHDKEEKKDTKKLRRQGRKESRDAEKEYR